MSLPPPGWTSADVPSGTIAPSHPQTAALPVDAEPTASPRTPTPSTVADVLGNLSIPAGFALLAALVMAAGSVGPWVDTFLGSLSGTRNGGDGVFTLAAAAVVFLLTLAHAAGKGGRLAPILSLLAALAAGVIATIDLSEIHDKLAGAKVFGTQLASAGWGIYAVIAGSALATIALFIADRGHGQARS